MLKRQHRRRGGALALAAVGASALLATASGCGGEDPTGGLDCGNAVTLARQASDAAERSPASEEAWRRALYACQTPDEFIAALDRGSEFALGADMWSMYCLYYDSEQVTPVCKDAVLSSSESDGPGE